MDKICKTISALSGLIAIFKFVKDSLEEAKISFSNFTILFLVISFVAIIIALFAKENRYYIYKYLSYALRSPKLTYNIIEKEIEYTYKTRYDLSYRKKEKIEVLTNGLHSWTSRFRWTKPQKNFKVKCLSSHNEFRVKRKGTWNYYTVDFDAAQKGNIRDIEVLVDDLADPKEESSKYLSSTIHEKVKKITYIVTLCNQVQLSSIKLLVYANSDEFPLLEEGYQFDDSSKNKHIKYDSTNGKITVTINYPVYGYCYKLAWEFK